MMDGITHVIWYCPNCNGENHDYFEWTAMPFCRFCQSEADWDVIAALPDTENTHLIELEESEEE